jgi:hypothetical protein
VLPAKKNLAALAVKKIPNTPQDGSVIAEWQRQEPLADGCREISLIYGDDVRSTALEKK